MNLDLSPEELAFRDDVRRWLGANVPDDLRQKVLGYRRLSREDVMRWHRILAGRGWVAPAWPREWGGPGWDVVERYLFEEEYALAGAPPLVPFGITMLAPVLFGFGTDAQRARYLPKILSGEEVWCQGYSEPGSGSDLASLRTRAERRDGHYVINGQKTWTTLAHWADWIFLLARTSPTAKAQEGISFLLVDMRTPGVTVRPLILIDGEHEVNEVFFEDVVVPAEQRVGAEGEGWTIAKFLLGYERLSTGRVGASKRELARLKELARVERKDGRPLLEDPRFRDRLSRVEIELMALEVTTLRMLEQLRGGKPPGAEVSLLKIKGTEIQQALTELMMEAVGPFALPFVPESWRDGWTGGFPGPEHAAALAARYFNYRKTTIYAGSNEIQRNIMTKFVLGL